MEIERTFLIKSLPEGISSCLSAHIEQGYLGFGDGDEPERRIRKLTEGDKVSYFYTEKGKGDLCREEEEYEIPAYSYENLRELVISATLEKTRYYFPIGELTAELDVYGGSLEGLTVAEVEFTSLEQAESFEPPAFFGEEITYDKKYRNKNLARK